MEELSTVSFMAGPRGKIGKRKDRSWRKEIKGNDGGWQDEQLK